MSKKTKVVYVIIDDYTDNPVADLKIFTDSKEALLEMGLGTSLRVYKVRDKSLETKCKEARIFKKEGK
tara:strand:+ start:1155 stop:1358 length:204 start_codon:yes stop_codon:yes gene_type:complete